MSSSSSKFINAFETKETSKILKYYKSFFNLLFPLYYEMLKEYSYSYYKELFFLIFEYLSLIIFHFSKPVSNFYNFLVIIIVSSYMEFKCYQSN